jgi:acetoin utilization deacetylase AcuC-like enzyme
MVTVIYDKAATEFGQDEHPERPARLINTETYLLDKHPDWAWMRPRLATVEEVLRAHRPEHLDRLRQPIDFDAHHGNGTEEIVSGNRRIRFASVHQYPGYPGTGNQSRGNSFNWPIFPGSDPREHVSAVHQALDRCLQFSPDLLLVSAGFDGYVADPMTNMTLEVEHFAGFGQRLRETALPTAAILEGGYSHKLPMLVNVFLEAWDGVGDKL